MVNKVSQNKDIAIKNALWLPTCQSTNTYALEYLKLNEVADGFIFYTYCQTEGRGQAKNKWESENNKNLTFSIIYHPKDLLPQKQFLLSITISLALVDFLKEKNVDAHIKWPNDIYVNKKKIAGILIENRLQGNSFHYSVIGIGLNINQKEFLTPFAISLSLLAQKEFDLDSLLLEVREKIQTRIALLQAKAYLRLENDYFEKLYLKNLTATFKYNGETFLGVIKGVNERGKLILEKEEGLFEFDFKEVEFVRE